MPVLIELYKEYERIYNEYKAAEETISLEIIKKKYSIQGLQKKLEKLEDKHKKLKQPRWYDTIIKPLAEAVLKELPEEFIKYDLGGPFGLDAAVHIVFLRKDEDAAIQKHNPDLTVIPISLTEGIFGYRDYTVNTGEYPRGTIGQINGMNFPLIKYPLHYRALDFARIAMENYRRKLENQAEKKS